MVKLTKPFVLAALIPLALAVGTSHAADRFAPLGTASINEPQVTIAPIELSNSDLSDGDVKAYRPWFENGAWQGDLIELDIDTNGVVSSTIDLTTSPPTSSPDSNTGEENWSARIQFEEATRDDDIVGPEDQYWNDERRIITGRKILTFNGNIAFRGIARFRWRGNDSLTFLQRALMDPANFFSGTSDLLDFVRGDRSNERTPDTPANPFRRRLSILGDIIHSQPQFIGPPNADINTQSYQDFANAFQNRPEIVVVGANDGMLHIFDAETGDEEFAYIPSILLSQLNRLAVTPYEHTYFVDGQIAVEDAFVAGQWRTMAVGGLGAGGKGFYILDLTNPAGRNEQQLATEGNNRVLRWEIDAESNNNRGLGDISNDIGFTYSRPTIAQFPGGCWRAIAGNGYLSANNEAKLIVMNMANGRAFSIETGSGDENSPNGLSAPAVIDANGDGTADTAYAGDLNGNLWRFNLSNICSGAIESITPIQPELILALGEELPIVAPPDVAENPAVANSFYIYVGTGRAFTDQDLIPNGENDSLPHAGERQNIYGVIDTVNFDNPQIPSVPPSTLEQQISERSFSTINNQRVRTSTANALNNFGSDPDRAWRIFDDIPLSERFLTEPQVRAGRTQISSFVPAESQNDPERNWFLQPSFSNGGAPFMPIFDINGDNSLNSSDNVNESGSQEDIVMGIELGPGIRSRATIAVISSNEDIALINGLAVPDLGNCPQLFADVCFGAFTDFDELESEFQEFINEFVAQFGEINPLSDQGLIDELNDLTTDNADLSVALNDALNQLQATQEQIDDLLNNRQDTIDFIERTQDEINNTVNNFVSGDSVVQGVQTFRNLGPNFGLGRRSWTEIEEI